MAEVDVELLTAICKNSARSPVLDVNCPAKRHVGIVLFQIAIVCLPVMEKINLNYFLCRSDAQCVHQVDLQLGQFI